MGGAKRTVDAAERRARLAIRHRLATSRRTDDVVQIANDIVAVHSSDPVTVYLSVGARMKHPSFEPLVAALYDDRTLVRHHAMRRTLWVLTPEVARDAHAAVTTGLVTLQRRTLTALLTATELVDDPDGWLDQARADTLAALDRSGPMTARRLGKEVPALAMKLQLAVGKSYGVSVAAHTRVLLLLGFEGAIVRTRPTGTWVNSEYNWSAIDSWLPGGLAGRDPVNAAGALAARWLHAFGPAPTSDLQWWTGWSARSTIAALASAGAVEVDLGGTTGWIAAGDLDRVSAPRPWVALLPGLDSTTMGWKRRDWYLAPDHVGELFDRNGNGGPTIWADGRIVGGWVQRRSGEIALKVLVDVGTEHRRAIDAAAADLQTLLGDVRFRVRFPAPMQAELLGETRG